MVEDIDAELSSLWNDHHSVDEQENLKLGLEESHDKEYIGSCKMEFRDTLLELESMFSRHSREKNEIICKLRNIMYKLPDYQNKITKE